MAERVRQRGGDGPGPTVGTLPAPAPPAPSPAPSPTPTHAPTSCRSRGRGALALLKQQTRAHSPTTAPSLSPKCSPDSAAPHPESQASAREWGWGTGGQPQLPWEAGTWCFPHGGPCFPLPVLDVAETLPAAQQGPPPDCAPEGSSCFLPSHAGRPRKGSGHARPSACSSRSQLGPSGQGRAHVGLRVGGSETLLVPPSGPADNQGHQPTAEAPVPSQKEEGGRTSLPAVRAERTPPPTELPTVGLQN